MLERGWEDVLLDYIVMAARTLVRLGTGAFLRPDTEGDTGFVIIYKSTSQTSRVPVPIVFPFSS